MNLQPTVLIVDDEKHTRDGLRSLLENDYDVYVAPDIAGAIDVLDRKPGRADLRIGTRRVRDERPRAFRLLSSSATLRAN